MARPRSNFYSTIEYIGPRPQKPKRRNFFGGWVILVIAMGIAWWFGKPLVPFLKAQQGISLEQTALLIASLEASGEPGNQIAALALAHAQEDITFDPAYYKIPYPSGDIAPNKGSAADVIIRCLRKYGIDLQQEVHRDMKADFRAYPELWGAHSPDTNIDHRRIPNLQRFFERNGKNLTASRDPADYRPGDIVVWSLAANAEKHIGIVVPGPGNNANAPWVVHHRDTSVKWEDVLFNFKIDAHFRYPDTRSDRSGN